MALYDRYSEDALKQDAQRYSGSTAGGYSLPNFEAEAQRNNQFMTGQAQAPYLANLPNYAQMIAQRSGNVTQQLKGQLPEDVIRQLRQQSAELGIATGTPGSPRTNSAYLRALGLNSLQMQQQASGEVSRLIADTPVPELSNPWGVSVPLFMGQQELNAARGGGGGSRGPYSNITGMPNVGIGGFGSPSSNLANAPAVGRIGYFDDRPATSPSTLASNWWNTYGGKNLNSNATFGSPQSPFNQFAEEDAYFANMAPPNQFAEEDAYFNNMAPSYNASSEDWGNYDWESQASTDYGSYE
jgi:hypothetical protein